MSEKDHLIYQAISDGTFKYAQQLVTKQLKKHPNSTYYTTLNAYILLSSNKLTECEKICLQIIDKIPTDYKTLKLLYIILRKLKKYTFSNIIFENAVKKTQDVNLIYNWLYLAMENLDISNLQKISVILMKKTPERRFVLWAAFNCFLAVENCKLSVLEGKLFPSLGLKMVENLKPLVNDQEVYVYVKLLQLLHKDEEIIELLQPNHNDLELQLIYLSVLEKSQNWELLFETCIDILGKRNDFNILCYLIKSSFKLDKQTQVWEMLHTTHSRNTDLAILEYAIFSNDSLNGFAEIYFQKYYTKPCVFPDLQNYTSHTSFNKESFLEFLDDQYKQRPIQENTDWEHMLFLVNYTRLKLHLDPTLAQSEFFSNLNIFFYNSVKHLLHFKTNTDYFPGSQFILNSISILLTNPTMGKILKAIVLLEMAVKHDTHEYRLQLSLIKLYTFLNCHNLSQQHTKVLDLKYLQLDTLTHHYLTRVSTISPRFDLTPIEWFYTQGTRDILQNLQTGYETGFFDKLNGMVGLAHRVKYSLSRIINIIENIKIQRIKGNKTIEQLANLIEFDVLSDDNDGMFQWFDNRDYDIIDEYACVCIGPKQGIKWVKIMYIRELIIVENNIEKLDILIKQIMEIDKNELTEIENWSVEIIVQLAITFKNKSTLIEVINLLNQKHTYKNNFEINHVQLTVLETIKSINQFLSMHNFPSKQTTILKPHLSDLQNYIKNNTSTLKTQKNLELETYKQELLTWGCAIDIVDNTFINDIFNGIKDCSDESILVIRSF